MPPVPHGHGLAEDLAFLRQRRNALRWLGAGAAAVLAGCGGWPPKTGDSVAACRVIPGETEGPFPGDGTNAGASGGLENALTQAGIVRSDLVASFGGATGSADGVPLIIQLKLVGASACAPLAGRAVYLWHCDALGRYSMYSPGVESANYLRGVQVSDDEGTVTFTSIFPGCYDGRWPHLHFEVFPSLGRATTGDNGIKTSQIALPQAAAAAVYADRRYPGSAANLAQTSLADDMVFSDGATLETPTITGSNATGYAIRLQVGLAS
jgi:protocatechuate 3,4-dioxygenase beta subunit